MHWFLPVLAAIRIIDGSMVRGGVGAGFYALVMAALAVTVLVHELGHCFAARGVGGHAEEILLWPLGGMAFVGHGGPPRDDIKVAVAGPLTHIPMGLLIVGTLFLIGLPTPWEWRFLNPLDDWIPFEPLGEYFWENLLVALLKLQVMLMLFNLLVPAYPLDGGRILTNFLMIRHGRTRAAIMTTYFSIPIGVAMIVFGCLRDGMILLVLIGLMVLFEAWQIHRLHRMGELEAHPMFGAQPEFDYMPDRPKKPGFFARWRARRARKFAMREAREAHDMSEQVDAVLEKVSREGMGSLTPSERKVLDKASKRSRGDS